MNNLRFNILLVLSFLFLKVKANSSDRNILLETLIKTGQDVSFISWQKEIFFSTGDSTFDTYPQNLIKSNGKLFVFINGSGKIYEVFQEIDQLKFKRIDSTIHFGYNIGSFGFSYKDKIYSLGGYGFWRMNGQLRVFNEKEKEWDIVKLNKEIPFITGTTEGIIWLDNKREKFYTAFFILKDEAIKSKGLVDKEYVYDVMELDLKSKEWVKIGNLNPLIINKLQSIKPITMSPWGQMVLIGDKISLLDYRNNKILALDIRKSYYQTIIRSYWACSFYFRDSTLIFGNKNKLDSVNISYKDFEYSGQTLYSKETYNDNIIYKYSYFFVSFCAILLIVVTLFLYFKKRHKLKDYKIEQIIKSSNPAQRVFDELEIQLLQLLIKNTESGLPTTTEQQNKVLGLSKKNIEIQKKQRSDIIISINRKFSFITKKDEPLILKRRTEFDKRAFEYFLEYSRLEDIKTFIKSNASES
jgi:hypothetical protein